MKNFKNAKKAAAMITLAILGTTVLSATVSADENPQEILISAPMAAKGWSNIGDDGELDGYEIGVLKAIDEKLPQYEFVIQGSDMNNTLLSLDTGKIDLGTFMFEYSDERAEKYLFANEGYANFSMYMIFPADAEETTLDSLAGKTVGAKQDGTNDVALIKKYNEAHPDQEPIELDFYGDISDEIKIQSLLEGRWDAIYGLPFWVDQYNNDYGNGQEIVQRGEILSSSYAYYLYPKDGQHEELRDAVDEALKELKQDGTLLELSEKYFGFDVTPGSEE